MLSIYTLVSKNAYMTTEHFRGKNNKAPISEPCPKNKELKHFSYIFFSPPFSHPMCFDFMG